MILFMRPSMSLVSKYVGHALQASKFCENVHRSNRYKYGFAGEFPIGRNQGRLCSCLLKHCDDVYKGSSATRYKVPRMDS